jgi:hypothetical protein
MIGSKLHVRSMRILCRTASDIVHFFRLSECYSGSAPKTGRERTIPLKDQSERADGKEKTRRHDLRSRARA